MDQPAPVVDAIPALMETLTGAAAFPETGLIRMPGTSACNGIEHGHHRLFFDIFSRHFAPILPGGQPLLVLP